MATRKNRNAETRKPEILEGYYQVLIEEGFEGSSIGKIAQHLNIHPTLILHYFKNKDNQQRPMADSSSPVLAKICLPRLLAIIWLPSM